MNKMTRHSPFGAMDSFFNDSFFQDRLPAFRLLPENRVDIGNIAVDIHETESGYSVKADFPGLSRDEIDVSVDNNVLTISAEHKDEAEEKDGTRLIRQERRVGQYSRSFNLGKDIDESAIEAEFDNGVLTLQIPKGDVALARKQIPIK